MKNHSLSSNNILQSFWDHKSKILSRKTLDERLAKIFDGHLSDQVRLSAFGKKLALVPFVSEEAEYLPLHSHDYLELIFILTGEGIHQIGERDYPVSRGQIFFLDNTLPHAFRRPKNGRLLYVNFSFLPALLSSANREDQWQPGLHFALVEPFFRDEGSSVTRLTLEGDNFIRTARLSLMMVELFDRSYPDRDPALRPLFQALISLVYREYSRIMASRPSIFSAQETLFRQILSKVNERLESKFTLADIARSLGIGRTRIAEIFKAEGGETVVQYANRIRIENACRLLKSSRLSILDVALECGFNDLSHFNRIFKRHTSFSPQRYRRSGQ